MRRVIIESPFAASAKHTRAEHVAYARAALYHSLSIGEAPIASHLLYPQVLNEDIPAQRDWGIEAGITWHIAATETVFYTDLGWSNGMRAANANLSRLGLAFVERQLPVDVMNDFTHGKFDMSLEQSL